MAAVNYDKAGDTLYIELAAGAEDRDSEGEEVHPGIVLMFDGDGRVIGIEITSASRVLPAGAVERLLLAAVE